LPDPSLDLGASLPHLGRVFRVFKEKRPDYTDSIVRDFILSRGESLEYYSDYAVVPKEYSLAVASIKKGDLPKEPFSQVIEQIYDRAFDGLERMYAPFLGDSKMSSWDEVISWAPVRKSPGYPWILSYQYKEDFYGTDLGEEFLETYWDSLATDHPIESLCAVSVKEEVRSRVKIYDQASVRTVYSMPVQHTFSHSRLTLDQNNRLVQSAGQHFMELGINIFYGGFHRLQAKHQAFAGGPEKKCSLAIDGVKFEKRTRRTHHMRIARLRYHLLHREWRTEKNRLRFLNLYETIAGAPLVDPIGHVFGREGDQTSGQSCTTPDNGFKNIADMFVIWCLSCLDNDLEEWCTWDMFTRFVLCSTNGDDINITVKEEAHHVFNAAVIIKYAAEIGMEYTLEFMEFRHFTDLTFLGHGFSLVHIPKLGHAMYLPVIDCQKMRSNCLIYNDEVNDPVAMTITRANGLRAETFACESCRDWFADLIYYLRSRYPATESAPIREAWTTYKTDSELWELYSGYEAVDIQ